MKVESLDVIAQNLPTPLITRRLHRELLDHLLREAEVTVLYGARQVGKSVEVFSCMAELLKREPHEDIFYFNLDIPSADFQHPDTFVNAIKARKRNPGGKTYIFLDEAQRLENIGLFTKYIYDRHLVFKFMLTGSASLDIKQKIKESLTGRKREFILSGLALDEILTFRGVSPNKIEGNFDLLQTVLADYLLFGGYPAIVTAATATQKAARLREVANSYLQKDLAALFGLEDSAGIRLVASYLAENTGNLLSVENVSKLTGLPKTRIQKILDALEKTFIAVPIYPFFKDKAKELTHRPKIYFSDLGIRNAVLNKLDAALIVAEKGQLFENALAIQLQSQFGLAQIKYWRTINQTEVDFIVEESFNKLRLFEAKYTWDQAKVAKNVASFKESYKKLLISEKVISKDNYWELFRQLPPI